jgi:hypothetical protein
VVHSCSGYTICYHPLDVFYLSIYLSIYSCCSLLQHRASVKLFVSLQFLNVMKSIGLLGRVINPTQGCYLHRTTQTQNKFRQIFMPIVRFEPTIPAFERANISCLRPRGHCDRLHFLRYYPVKANVTHNHSESSDISLLVNHSDDIPMSGNQSSRNLPPPNTQAGPEP